MNETQFDLRILPVKHRGEPVMVEIDGRQVQAYAGETVLTVMLASGMHAVRRTSRLHEPRGAFCAQGVCFECLVTINGEANVRACMTKVQPGMVVDTGGFEDD